MKSKTSLFDRTIVLNLLQRYWVLFAGYFIAMGGSLLIPLLNNLQSTGTYARTLAEYAGLYELLQYAPNVAIVGSFIAAPVAATLLFSYLYNARHTGLMTSLPITRQTMFLSVSAAGLVGFTLCNGVILLLGLLLELIYGSLSLTGLGLTFLMLELTMVVFFGIAVFCCMLTGNIFAGPAVYVIFNFLTVGLEMLVYNLLLEIVYGITRSYTPYTTPLCPTVQLGESLYFTYELTRNEAGTLTGYTWSMEGLGILAIYAVVGLVFLGLALVLYKNRRMEVAGDTIAIEILKPVFRLCMTAGGGLVIASLIKETLYSVELGGWAEAVYLMALLILGGTLGYFISQMLITRSISVFRSGWKSVGLYAVCTILLVSAVEADLFGYERRVPDAGKVESVIVNTYQGYEAVELKEAANIEAAIALHKSITQNKALHDDEFAQVIPLDADPGAQNYGQSLELTYYLENGKIMSRRYTLHYGPNEIRAQDSDIRLLEALINTTEAIHSRYVLPFPVTGDNVNNFYVNYRDKEAFESGWHDDLSHSEAARLYNECILPDIADGDLGYIHLIENLDYAENKLDCTITLTIYEKTIPLNNGGHSYQNYRDLNFYIPVTATRTIAFLEELGIHPATIRETYLHDGVDFSDLGRYDLDGVQDPKSSVTREATSAAIIGGADAPANIVVCG